MLKSVRKLFKFPGFHPVRYFSNDANEYLYTIHPRFRDQGKYVNCLVLHPVMYPNKGPDGEFYLAEEAIGLAKSLDWNISEGPFGENKGKTDVLKEEEEEESDDDDGPPRGRGRKRQEFIPKQGDYVYTDAFQGIYDRGAVLLDLWASDEEEDFSLNEWKNPDLRAKIARSSLFKLRQTTKNTFFTKGKIIEIGKWIHQNEINAVFVNNELTSLQTRNLETQWLEIVNMLDGRNPSSHKAKKYEEEEDEEQGIDPRLKKRVKVFDRFTIILQIFAKRARNRVAKLQIELAFLDYMRTKLTRDGTTFSGMYDIFTGNLMRAQEVQLEVVSGKQRGGSGKLSGQGETQLEIERRIISDKEAKIRRELVSEIDTRQKIREKRKSNALNSVPNIALIGYTNAGKSALMNRLTQAHVASDDKLFQTLVTVSKKLKLHSGQLGVLFDTIGFITNLPHDLVESFKSTLEEVRDADIVLHVRDINHPNTEDQKRTVLRVLEELGFDQSFYTKKMVEVWNKIDQIENPIDEATIQNSEFPIVPISALHGTNCDKLLEIITTKSNEILGKRSFKFVHAPEHHQDRLAWLYKNANIVETENFDYQTKPTKEYPTGKISFEAFLDEVTYKKYQSLFVEKKPEQQEEQQEEVVVKAKEKAPEKAPDDWLKGSKSFFERRKEEQERKKAMGQPNKPSNKL